MGRVKVWVVPAGHFQRRWTWLRVVSSKRAEPLLFKTRTLVTPPFTTEMLIVTVPWMRSRRAWAG